MNRQLLKKFICENCYTILDKSFPDNNTIFLSNYFYASTVKENVNNDFGCLYCNNNCNNYGQKIGGDIVTMIGNLLSVVFKYQSKVIGSYVREYLIGKMEFENNKTKIFTENIAPLLIKQGLYKDVYNIIKDYYGDIYIPPPMKDPKDIDVWVQDTKQYESILEEYRKQGYKITNRPRTIHQPPTSVPALNDDYNVPVYQHFISNQQGIQIWMDFIVSPVCQINDFSFNLLSWDGRNLNCESTDEKYTLETILDQIKTRQGYVLSEYCGALSSHQRQRFSKIVNYYQFKIINIKNALF